VEDKKLSQRSDNNNINNNETMSNEPLRNKTYPGKNYIYMYMDIFYI